MINSDIQKIKLKRTKPIKNAVYINIFIVLIVTFLPYGMVNGYPHYYYIILGISAGYLDTELRNRKYASKVITQNLLLDHNSTSA